MFDPSEYMKPFRKYADIDVGGLVFPDPSEIRFGEKGYAGELTQFFKTNVTNVWALALPSQIRLPVLEDLGTLTLSMIEGLAKDLLRPILEAISDIAGAIPFVGAVIRAGTKLIDVIREMGKAYAKYLDMDRVFKRWVFERYFYLKGGDSGNAFFTMDRMPRYAAYGPTGVKLGTDDLYRRIGAFWGTASSTILEFTPIFYPWISPALGMEPLKAIPHCHTFSAPVRGKCWGATSMIQDLGSLYTGKKDRKSITDFLELPDIPDYFDRNSMFSAYQASLLQDPAANFAIHTSLIQRLTKVLDDLKPGTKKGRLNADSFEVTADHITTAKRAMAVFLQAREGFLADPNACLRAASSGVRLDPALKTVIKENANQGLKDIAGGLGSGSSGGVSMVTISPGALKAAAEAMQAQQKSESSGGSAILLLGAAAAAAGIYAVTRKR